MGEGVDGEEGLEMDSVILAADFKKTVSGDEVVTLVFESGGEVNRSEIIKDVDAADFEKNGAVRLELTDVGERVGMVD